MSIFIRAAPQAHTKISKCLHYVAIMLFSDTKAWLGSAQLQLGSPISIGIIVGRGTDSRKVIS